MNYKKCENAALFRYTWPGNDESFICLEHSLWLQKVANAIGLHLQMIQVNQRHELDINNEIRYCGQKQD